MKKDDQLAEAVALAAVGGWDPTARRRGFLGLCLLPALILLAFVLVYPLFYNVMLSLSDASIYRIRDWQITGIQQYLNVFRDQQFWVIFSKTVVWTAVSTFLQVAIGVALAIVLNQDFIRGRSAWRFLLLLPWAMPQYITALTWRGMFHGENGAVNQFLANTFGLPPVEWLTSPVEAFTAAIPVSYTHLTLPTIYSV